MPGRHESTFLPPPPSEAGPPLRQVVGRLRPWGALVQVLLFAAAIIEVGLAWSVLRRVNVLDDYTGGHGALASVASWDDRVHGWAVTDIVALIVTGVVFVTWLVLAHRAAERNNPHLLRYGRGWAIGGWLVPILNLWRPPQVVNDVLNALERPTDRWGWSPPGHRLVTAWWAFLLAGNVIDRLNPDWHTLDELHRWSRVAELSSVLTIVAAVLAIVLVGRITSAADQRRSETLAAWSATRS